MAVAVAVAAAAAAAVAVAAPSDAVRAVRRLIPRLLALPPVLPVARDRLGQARVTATSWVQLARRLDCPATRPTVCPSLSAGGPAYYYGHISNRALSLFNVQSLSPRLRHEFMPYHTVHARVTTKSWLPLAARRASLPLHLVVGTGHSWQPWPVAHLGRRLSKCTPVCESSQHTRTGTCTRSTASATRSAHLGCWAPRRRWQWLAALHASSPCTLCSVPCRCRQPHTHTRGT